MIWCLSPLSQFVTMGSDTDDEAIFQNLISEFFFFALFSVCFMRLFFFALCSQLLIFFWFYNQYFLFEERLRKENKIKKNMYLKFKYQFFFSFHFLFLNLSTNLKISDRTILQSFHKQKQTEHKEKKRKYSLIRFYKILQDSFIFSVTSHCDKLPQRAQIPNH